MNKTISAWYHRHTPEIVTTGVICFVWMLFFHWMRGISWSGAIVLAVFDFVAGAALGTLMVRLLNWNRR